VHCGAYIQKGKERREKEITVGPECMSMICKRKKDEKKNSYNF
jgi:hypothetical protein